MTETHKHASPGMTLGTGLLHPVIAIDGGAGTGKGTLARRLAQAYQFDYLDSGLIYRAVGALVLERGLDPADEVACLEVAQGFQLSDMAHPGLRTESVAKAASQLAFHPAVRQALLGIQHQFMAQPPSGRGVVIDGRDIGTVICPQATCKIFLTASLAVRAERRFRELQQLGLETTVAEVLQHLQQRDTRDQTRHVAPLKAAPDALVVDTSTLTPDQVYEIALAHCKGALS